MPNAARERVASPPAGSALARAARACLPGRVLIGRDSEVYVTVMVTRVNTSVTVFLSPLPLRERVASDARKRGMSR